MHIISIGIVSQIYGAFSLRYFLLFFNVDSHERSNYKKLNRMTTYFHPSETKTLKILQQLGLLFLGDSRGGHIIKRRADHAPRAF